MIRENNESNTSKIVNGGLVVMRLNRLMINEEHYGLYKARFDLEKLREKVHPEIYEKAEEVKHYLDMKEPSGMNAYARKFRSYNQILLIQDLLKQLKEFDGPHQVRIKRVASEDGIANVYEVTLNAEFCERVNIPQTGVIKLRIPERRNDEEIRGRMLHFDEETHVVKFFPLNRHEVPEVMYNVSFEPSRFVYNAREFILINANALQNKVSFLIFPEPLDPQMSKEKFIEQRDKMIGDIQFASQCFNREQREAICSILMGQKLRVYNRSSSLMPYIIHGPPGTGKTATLVETVRLLLKQSPNNRIVVCTPSNTAADLFARELLRTLQQTNMNSSSSYVFRMHALGLSVTQLDESLKDISLITENQGVEMFGIPPRAVLENYKVIICTVMASVYLALGGMSHKFSHLFMDECGQISELDTLVPIVGLIANDTKIVMAGDHHQLGPMDTMDYFQKNSITKSFIERFHGFEYYKNDPRVVTFLHQNYRSHESIITVPSRLFYGNKLVTATDAKPRDKLSNWSMLPNKGFPILWHHIETKEQREQNGTSYMNQGELDQVILYAKSIVDELHVRPLDIGVVSPYEYQARRIRQRLHKNYTDITVDTVERFQGSQRRVIIVSTVRCNPDDKLGFMKCPKRFNTTITRAEELLVIVGNAKTMAQNGSWRSLLRFCHENKATIDVPAPLMDQIIGKVAEPEDEKSGSEEDEQESSCDEDEEESSCESIEDEEEGDEAGDEAEEEEETDEAEDEEEDGEEEGNKRKEVSDEDEYSEMD